jgi:hypothetical protein
MTLRDGHTLRATRSYSASLQDLLRMVGSGRRALRWSSGFGGCRQPFPFDALGHRADGACWRCRQRAAAALRRQPRLVASVWAARREYGLRTA